MLLTRAAVAEHGDEHEDLTSVPAGDDDPAAAGERCTEGHKIGVPPEEKSGSVAPTFALREITLLGNVSASHTGHTHPSSSTCTPTHPQVVHHGCRALEPAVFLAVADIVSRVCSKVCCGAEIVREVKAFRVSSLSLAVERRRFAMTFV